MSVCHAFGFCGVTSIQTRMKGTHDSSFCLIKLVVTTVMIGGIVPWNYLFYFDNILNTVRPHGYRTPSSFESYRTNQSTGNTRTLLATADRRRGVHVGSEPTVATAGLGWALLADEGVLPSRPDGTLSAGWPHRPPLSHHLLS